MIFFLAIYLVTLGSGCVKPNMIVYEAHQFNQENPKQLKKLSPYLNVTYIFFILSLR